MKILPPTLAALALATALGAAAEAAPSQCFRISEMGGWRATPDARTMYMRVRLRDVYEVQFRGSCPGLNRIGVHLVHKVTSDTVCHPLDFDVRVADAGSHMPAIQCSVASYRLMTPTEVDALPKKLRP